MRRENRRKSESKRSIYITIGILAVAIITFIITFIAYSNKLDKELYSLDSEYLAQYTNQNNEDETTTASSAIGKKVDELEKGNSNNANSVVKNDNIITTNSNTLKKDNSTTNISTASSVVTKKKSTTTEKDPEFIMPVEGNISKEFAKDSLVYSETLKEWTTHLGIDILAERATVVKSSADGIVKYIKNDPRYGLSIIIEHSNGFQTIYANLLTTDFVSEGEEVKAGQTIGTVGDSSVYEVVDESHLHFEILKDGENVNPIDYIKNIDK